MRTKITSIVAMLIVAMLVGCSRGPSQEELKTDLRIAEHDLEGMQIDLKHFLLQLDLKKKTFANLSKLFHLASENEQVAAKNDAELQKSIELLDTTAAKLQAAIVLQEQVVADAKAKLGNR